MRGFLRRSGGFFVKEIRDVLRQPRLILTLVVGPFLVLLLLGVGYKQNRPDLRAVFVAPGGAEDVAQIEEYALLMTSRLDLEEVTTEATEALERLRLGHLDIVAVFPSDPEARLLNSRTAPITVYHAELDPFDEAYIRFVAELAATEINEELLETLAAEGQQESEGLATSLDDTRAASTTFQSAVAAGDTTAALEARRDLVDSLDRTIEEASTLASIDPSESDDLERLRAARDSLGTGDLPGQAEAVANLDADLAAVEQRLDRVRSIDPEVLVRPFRAEAESIAAAELRVDDYYSPGVVALLVQHLAITFAALSIVAEHRLGATELFQVAPVRTSEMLIGKYLGYAVMTGVVSGLLLAGLFGLFGSPLAGSLLMVILVVTLLVLASLGIGFILSAVARSDSQAIQFAMLVLLASIFLSGFFLSSDRLESFAAWTAQALPVTHAIELMRQEMFLGAIGDVSRLWVLGGLSGGYAVLAWILGARRLSAS